MTGYRRPTLTAELASARELLTTAGIEVRIDSARGPFPAEIDEVLAWTVREGATNVIRHSHAQHCEICVTEQDNFVRVEVIDDGDAPPDVAAESVGTGLSGLAERLAEIDGQLVAGPATGGGFRLQVLLPLAEWSRPTTISRGASSHGAARR